MALNSSSSHEKITAASLARLQRFKKSVRAIGFDNNFNLIREKYAQLSPRGEPITPEILHTISPKEIKEMGKLIKGYLAEQNAVTLPGENIAFVKGIKKQLQISAEE